MKGQKGPSGEAEVNTKSDILKKDTKLSEHCSCKQGHCCGQRGCW